MSANIEQIKPETLAILEKQAKVFRLSVDEYLRSLLPKIEKELPLEGDANDEFESDMTVFAEGTENLSDYKGNYSREYIFFDHD